MKFTPRTYNGAVDQPLMRSLADSCFRHNLHNIALPYRLCSWALDDRQNAQLWFTAEARLAAWAVLNTPFWAVDMVCAPNYETDLLPLILDWVDKRAAEMLPSLPDHTCWFIPAFPWQTERIKILEESGWACQTDVGEDSWSKVLMRRDDSALEKTYPPPTGFAVRPLRGQQEVQAYVNLHQAVFETKNMTVDWRARILHQPDYTPELDMVVQTPDGSLGAFSIGWVHRLQDGNLVGQVEPLGCAAQYRNRALGRVALADVLERMLTLGVRKIFVETDNYRDTAFRLYESLGFRVVDEVWQFRKDFV